MRALVRRVRDVFEGLRKGHTVEAMARPGLAALYLLRLAVQVFRQWAADRCPQQAASLAFQTALSLAPLIAVALSLMRGMGMFEESSNLVDYLARQVIPVSADEIAEYLKTWSGKQAGAAGFAGLGVALFVAFIMYNNVEQIWNDIWRVERRRSIAHRAVVFYVVITVVPTMLAFSLYQATQFGLTEGWQASLTSLAATWSGLILANKLLPRTEVRWRPAIIGALVSALAFELAKAAFQIYVAEVAFRSYAGIYGTLALIPLFLLWIYYSWTVVLLGAEITHAMQNLKALERRRRLVEGDETPVPDGVWGLRVATAVARHYGAGLRVLARTRLVADLAAPEEVIEGTLRRLRDGGILLEAEIEGDLVGYLPARPLEDVTAQEIMALFRSGDFARRGETGKMANDPLEKLLAELDNEVKGRTKTITLAQLAGRGP